MGIQGSNKGEDQGKYLSSRSVAWSHEIIDIKGVVKGKGKARKLLVRAEGTPLLLNFFR